MDQFPQEHELISVFESEPELLDPDLPWAYNRLTFKTQRGDDHVVYVIEPASRMVQIEWSRNGDRVVSLDLNSVSSLEIVTESPVEQITAHFSEDGPVHPCVLQLKPAVRLSWGAN